jgi:O-methyltransferase involved in polyketide biosynthesis
VSAEVPDSTAVRTALWRARHVEVDAAPPVIDDVVGLQLVAPDDDWRDRGDMHPLGTRGFRASIVARARFIEDLVVEQAGAGVAQYVILGAGLDTLAQRRSDLGDRLRIYEVTSRGRRPGSGAAWSSSSSASPGGCGSCRSTSSPASVGGTG